MFKHPNSFPMDLPDCSAELPECSACQSRRAQNPKFCDEAGNFRNKEGHVLYFEDDRPDIRRMFIREAEREPNLCVFCIELKEKLEKPKNKVVSSLTAVDDGATCPLCHPNMGGEAIKRAMALARRELISRLFPDSGDDSEDDSEGVGGPRLCGKCMAQYKKI